MVQIQNYNPGSAPNLSVGTPGANYAPGQAFRSLASEIGQVRDQLAQANSQRLQSVITPLASLAGNIGRSLGSRYTSLRAQQVQNLAKQNEMLANQSVNDTVYSFRDNANKARNQFQQMNQDRPQDGVDQYSSFLDNAHQAAIDDFDSGPHKRDFAARNKLTSALNDARLSQRESMDSWSRSAQTDQVKANIDNAVAQTKQEISNADGDIDIATRAKNYQSLTQNVHSMILGSEQYIGAHNVAVQRLQLMKEAPVAFFQNLATTVPEDPEEALSYVHAARALLDNSEHWNMPMDAADKVHMQSAYGELQNKVIKDMEGKLTIDDMGADRNNAVLKQRVDQFWNDPSLQQQALSHASQQTNELNKRAQGIAQDPNMPEPVKQTYLKSIGTQISHLDTLTNAAKSNLHHIDTLNKQGMQAALTTKRHEDFESQLAARKELKESGDKAQFRLDDMRNQLTVLGQKPVDNMAQIQDQSKEMYAYAKQMGAAGYLTPAEAESYQQNALKAVSGAAQYQRSAPNIFGIPMPTWGQPPVKKQKFDKTQDARNSALSDVMGAMSDLHTMGHQAQVNQAGGLKPSQQQYFNENYASWLQARSAAGKPPTDADKQRMQFQIRTLAVKQLVPAEAAKKTPGNHLVPPPPPYTPSVLPEYGEHDNNVYGVSSPDYAPAEAGYKAVSQMTGAKYLIAPGTIDLSKRQIISNPENPQHPDPREYGSEYSARHKLPNGDWITFPTIYGGAKHTVKEAYSHAVRTGQHMGIYSKDIPEAQMNEIETALHSRPITVKGKRLDGELWASLHGVTQ